MSATEQSQSKVHERRWLILGVLCVSLLVIVLDNTVLNVALPEIVQQLKASNSQLQWMIDAYTLVFAGLLLTMGSLGDKFGRRPALQAGFVIFGLGSAISALANTANQLIATRALMGVGAALIMPATLSIITNVFEAAERPKAIAIWTATAGAGVALGPLIGGILLEHFYWGSIFLVNVPIVVIGLIAGVVLIPDSKDPRAPRFDPYGAFLSIVSLTALLYAVIEGPTRGWSDGQIVLAFVIGGLALPAFFDWERRTDHPMLDITFWTNPRFSAASGAIALAFFALAGTLFLLTQYFQFVLGLDAFETGVRLLAYAVPVAIVSPIAPRIVDRIGTKLTVAGGLALVTVGLVMFRDVDELTSGSGIVLRMALIAAGVALTMAPATESIMGSLPLARAGVGSAINDTTRQMGAAVGVAVIGSVFSSIYNHKIADALTGRPAPVVATAKSSLGAALAVAAKLPDPAGRAFAVQAKHAFVSGFQAAGYVGAAVTLVGVVVVLVFLPARARPAPADAGTPLPAPLPRQQRTPKQVVQRYLDALVVGDIATVRDSFAEDATWTVHGDLPLAGPWRGRDEIVDDFLAAVGGALFEPGSQSFEFPTMIGEGDTVALEWRVRARSASGSDYDNEYSGIFVVRDGRIVAVREYLDSRYAARVLFPELTMQEV